MEDNDAAGAKHTAVILRALRDEVPNIGVMRFPELKPGGDLTDFFERPAATSPICLLGSMLR
jgi:hypothetical protein